jgi:hypothetical protein
MHANFSRPKSLSLTVEDFFQWENVARDTLGEICVEECQKWFKSERIARCKVIKKNGLDPRVSLLSAYSFKQYLWELQMMKKRFLRDNLDAFGVLLLDLHLERDNKTFHKDMLELLLFNPDLHALSQYHMKVPTLFLIEMMSTSSYNGQLIPSTGEKWQAFLFLQGMVLFVKLLVNDVLLSGNENNAEGAMISFTLIVLLVGALVLDVMMLVFLGIYENTKGKTLNSRFWADRRFVYGIYMVIGLGGLLCTLWLTAMITMSSRLSGSPLIGNVGFSTSIAIVYVSATILTYFSKLCLSFEPLNAGNVVGMMYYGTIRLCNSSTKLFTMLLEWLACYYLCHTA